MSLSSTFSVQLSVRGNPSAFDLMPRNDIVIIASPGCLTFFDCNGLGEPKHVINYEQPQQVHRLKCQKNGSYFGALRGGIVSLWDSLNSLNPVYGFISSAGWITNLDWNYKNHYLLSTSCDSGDVRIWDSRVLSNSIQSLNVGGPCSFVGWCPFDSNLISASKQGKVYIFDIRMFTLNSNSSESYFSIDQPNDCINCEWSAENISTTEPILIVNQPFISSIEFWNISTKTKINEINSTFAGSITDIIPIPNTSDIILCSRELSPENSSVTLQPISSTSSKSAALTSIVKKKSHNQPDTSGIALWRMFVNHNNNSNNNSNSSHPSNHSNLPLHTTNQKECIKLAMTTEPILGLRWGSPGQLLPPFHTGSELLLLTASSALHAIKIPPNHNSNNNNSLLSTNTINKNSNNNININSNKLANISNITTTNNDMSSPSINTFYTIDPTPKYSVSSLRRSHLLDQQRPYLTTNRSSTTTTTTKAVGEAMEDKDKRQEAEAETDRVLSSPVQQQQQQQQLDLDINIWSIFDQEILSVTDLLHQGQFPGLSISPDYYTKQVTYPISKLTLDLTRPQSTVFQVPTISPTGTTTSTSSTVAASSDRLERLPGPLSFHNITNKNNNTPSATSTNSSNHGLFDTTKISLIITSPSSGLSSFAVRGDNVIGCKALDIKSLINELSDIMKTCIANGNHATGTSTIPSVMEPTGMMRRMGERSSRSIRSSSVISSGLGSSYGLLLLLSKCFYTRVMQSWGVKAEKAALPLLAAVSQDNQEVNENLLSAKPLATDSEKDDLMNTAVESEGSIEDDSDGSETERKGKRKGKKFKKQNDFEAALPIEKQAYRVPFPATSGSVFSSQGVLLCFGPTKLITEPLLLPTSTTTTTTTTGKVDLVRSISIINSEGTSSHHREAVAVTSTSGTDKHYDNMTDNNNDDVKYLKTYADMLVMIRDAKASEKLKYRSRSLLSTSNTMKSSDALHRLQYGYNSTNSFGELTSQGNSSNHPKSNSVNDLSTSTTKTTGSGRTQLSSDNQHIESNMEREKGSYDFFEVEADEDSDTDALLQPDDMDDSFVTNNGLMTNTTTTTTTSDFKLGLLSSNTTTSTSLFLNQGDSLKQIGDTIDGSSHHKYDKLSNHQKPLRRWSDGEGDLLLQSKMVFISGRTSLYFYSVTVASTSLAIHLSQNYCLGSLPLPCDLSDSTIKKSKTAPVGVVLASDVFRASFHSLLEHWSNVSQSRREDSGTHSFPTKFNITTTSTYHTLPRYYSLIKEQEILLKKRISEKSAALLSTTDPNTNKADSSKKQSSLFTATLASTFSLSQITRAISNPKSTTGGSSVSAIPVAGPLPMEAATRSCVCRYNSLLTLQYGMTAASRIWNMLAVSFDLMAIPARKARGVLTSSWRTSALGLPLMQRTLDCLRKSGEMILLAVVICVLGGSKAVMELLFSDQEDIVKGVKQGEEGGKGSGITRFTLITLDMVLLSYIDVLRKWQLPLEATEVMKYVSATTANFCRPCETVKVTINYPDLDYGRKSDEKIHSVGVTSTHKSLSFSLPYSGDTSIISPPQYSYQSILSALRCALCETILRSPGYICISCGHGGHPKHMEKWFTSNVECPTGCGCYCACASMESLDHSSSDDLLLINDDSKSKEFLRNFVYDFEAIGSR